MKHANVAKSGLKWAAHIRAAMQHVELPGSRATKSSSEVAMTLLQILEEPNKHPEINIIFLSLPPALINN